jgi:hypothetical protein
VHTEQLTIVSPNGISVRGFGPRYKRALTAIQVISMVPERVKWPLTLLLESEEIENEGDRRDSVHEGGDDEKSVILDLDVNTQKWKCANPILKSGSHIRRVHFSRIFKLLPTSLTPS